MNSLLTKLADELLVQDITKPSAVLGSISDHDLQAAYDQILEHFTLALLIGAHEDSERCDGSLVIARNRGRIHLLQTACYAVKLEVEFRGVVLAAIPWPLVIYHLVEHPERSRSSTVPPQCVADVLAESYLQDRLDYHLG